MFLYLFNNWISRSLCSLPKRIHFLSNKVKIDLTYETYFNPNSVKCRKSLSPYTVNYDINFQICLWKRIWEVLVYINSSSWTRVLIKWSYFGCGCVLYDLLYMWLKSKFSVARISFLAYAMHLERVNLIFERKNCEIFSCFHFIWIPFFNCGIW